MCIVYVAPQGSPYADSSLFEHICRNPSFGLATKAKGVARLRAKRKEARESKQRHCKSAGQEEARELRQEEARESHHILPGV
jgi:ADP-glucose pyrophosphorylase